MDPTTDTQDPFDIPYEPATAGGSGVGIFKPPQMAEQPPVTSTPKPTPQAQPTPVSTKEPAPAQKPAATKQAATPQPNSFEQALKIHNAANTPIQIPQQPPTQGQDNASILRENQGQPSQVGQVSQSGQIGSGGNLQQEPPRPQLGQVDQGARGQQGQKAEVAQTEPVAVTPKTVRADESVVPPKLRPVADKILSDVHKGLPPDD